MFEPTGGERTGPPVLVTGAGGPAAVAVIRAVAAAGRRVVACDSDPLAVGLRLAGDGAVLPTSDDPGYIDQLCRLAEKTSATTLVSTLAEEMPLLVAQSAHLTDAGLRFWLPDPEVVRTCLDKWLFAGAMLSHGMAIPPTAVGSAEGIDGPWVVKPRFGRGSRGVQFVDDERGLAWALARTDQPLVQTRLKGREFTVDVLVDRDGTLAAAVPRWRLEAKAGISVKGETFRLPALTAAVARVTSVLGLVGAANVQGFVDESRSAVTFTEVNPRFSGGLPLSIAAGADIVGEYLHGVQGLPLRPGRLTFRPGVRMLRYHQEVFEG